MISLHRQEAKFERLYGLLEAGQKPENDGFLRRFPVRRGNEFKFVLAADVDWIEGLGDYAGLHVGGKIHLIREALTSLETRLDRKQFVRIHRSTIVQLERIIRVGTFGESRRTDHPARWEVAAVEPNLPFTIGGAAEVSYLLLKVYHLGFAAPSRKIDSPACLGVPAPASATNQEGRAPTEAKIGSSENGVGVGGV